MNRYPAIMMIAALTLVLRAPVEVRAAEEKKPEKTLASETDDAIAQFKKTDSKIDKLFSEATGYAVFPTVAKGAIGVGAAQGDGQVYEKGKLIGTASLTQVTIGLQLGGQAYSEVIFFETKTALDDFKAGKFAISAQVSAVAAAEGASGNAKYQQGVLVFTVAKGGLMYEASVGGQKFKFIPLKK